jgi:hypothetical protein
MQKINKGEIIIGDGYIRFNYPVKNKELKEESLIEQKVKNKEKLIEKKKRKIIKRTRNFS